jgi:hypothetical protein
MLTTLFSALLLAQNDNTRHILDKAEWDRINIGDTN